MTAAVQGRRGAKRARGPLQLLEAPLTGFYRDGCCHTVPKTLGATWCAVMTEAFLQFSSRGQRSSNTPAEFTFPAAPGDRWCLCADRWREADEAGCAPRWYWRRRTKMPSVH